MKLKLIFVIILISISNVFATPSYSQVAKVTLDIKDTSLSQVMDEIENQSEFYFIFNQKQIDVNRVIDIQAENKSIDDVLPQLFAGTNVNYVVLDRKILLTTDKLDNSLLAIASESELQQVVVSGTVTDAKTGETLPGVNVVIVGTTLGVVTNISGFYTLEVPNASAALQFSFVGYTTREVPVAGQNVINVALTGDLTNLDEVVVIGYGTTSKRQTVSAISTVQSDKLQNIPVATIADRIAGRASGIIVVGSGGGPGKKPTISVRGGGTPLVVIDGIVASMTDFQNLNPADIDNLSILKDAESAAMYGARGGNGIIAVTTKRGEDGKMKISYDYSLELSQPTAMPTKLGSYEVALMANEARANNGQSPAFPSEVVQKYKDQSDPYNFPNTNWEDLCLNTFAPTSRHNLSVTGGNTKTKYFATVSYYDQGTLYKFKTNWSNRYNYRLSLTNNFDKIGLTANLNVYGVLEKTRFPESQFGTGQTIWWSLQNAFPYQLAYNDLGLYASGPDNCLVEIDPKSGYDLQESRNINGILDLTWEVPGVKGLKFKAINHYRLGNGWEKRWNATADQYTLGSSIPVTQNAPRLATTATTGYSFTNQVYGDYTRTFIEDHLVAATFGYEQTYGYDESIYANRVGYKLLLDQYIAGPTLNSTNGGSASENGRAGLLGRLRYVYKSKYFVEGSFRHDGSDWFPKENRWGTFWSGSAGWIVSEEAFLETLNEKNIINFLKIRGSYGTVGLDGSDANISRFQYAQGYNMVGQVYVINNNLVQGFTEGALVSPDLTWYTQHSRNIGLDFASLNSKLSGSFDYFYLTTTGMLASLSSSLYTDPLGTSLPTKISNGKYRRAGFDVSLNYKNSIGDLQYEIGGNLTRFDQMWETNPYEDDATLKNPNTRTTYQTGYYDIGYHSLGYYTSAEDVINSPKLVSSTNLAPGDIKYEDTNGDGQIDDADKRRIGANSFPRMNFGINLDLRYKAWFLYSLIQGSGNKDLYPGDVVQGNYVLSGGVGGVYTYHKDYWTPDNTDAQFPRLMSSGTYNGNNNYVTSDFWLVNARYVRLKSLQLGYDLKQQLLKNTSFISECSIILSGMNLVTFSEVMRKYSMDPESGSNNNYDYPTDRIYSLKIKIGF